MLAELTQLEKIELLGVLNQPDIDLWDEINLAKTHAYFESLFDLDPTATDDGYACFYENIRALETYLTTGNPEFLAFETAQPNSFIPVRIAISSSLSILRFYAPPTFFDATLLVISDVIKIEDLFLFTQEPDLNLNRVHQTMAAITLSTSYNYYNLPPRGKIGEKGTMVVRNLTTNTLPYMYITKLEKATLSSFETVPNSLMMLVNLYIPPQSKNAQTNKIKVMASKFGTIVSKPSSYLSVARILLHVLNRELEPIQNNNLPLPSPACFIPYSLCRATPVTNFLEMLSNGSYIIPLTVKTIASKGSSVACLARLPANTACYCPTTPTTNTCPNYNHTCNNETYLKDITISLQDSSHCVLEFSNCPAATCTDLDGRWNDHAVKMDVDEQIRNQLQAMTPERRERKQHQLKFTSEYQINALLRAEFTDKRILVKISNFNSNLKILCIFDADFTGLYIPSRTIKYWKASSTSINTIFTS